MRQREDQARHVVLASDATHLYAHIEGGRVFPITYNVGEVLDGYDTIKRLAPSRETHRSGARSAGAGALSGGAAGARRLGRAARRRSENA